MVRDIVDVALAEEGYCGDSGNHTKYGAWYGMNGAAWCHMFVSWCANQAGIPESIIPKTASCSSGMSWFQSRGLFRYKGQYTPKHGDIVYFKSCGASHVGIVVSCSNGTVYTIEGNSNNAVKQRNYPLTKDTITGYGTPSYPQESASGGSSEAKPGKSSELKYLKRVLERKKPENKKELEAAAKLVKKLPECRVSVVVNNGKKKFKVPVKDGMKLVWERVGTPGKLTFEAFQGKKFKITEGNEVLLIVDGKKMFYGFVFSRKMKKDGFVSYTVYDQLRYLKNKDTISYKRKRADEVVALLAAKFGMQCGKLENTGIRITRLEEDTELFDIIQNALDETLMLKGIPYVLYDEVGKLRLSRVGSLKVDDCLVDEDTGEDFSYTASIDNNVYNQIVLAYKNNEKGTRDLYVVRDRNKINKWGVLQYTEEIDSPDVGKLKANALLKLYGKKQRTLSISGVIGNKSVRAGSLVPVFLDLGDIRLANYMLVEKVTHTFNNRQHSMDLTVSGGDFSG